MRARRRAPGYRAARARGVPAVTGSNGHVVEVAPPPVFARLQRPNDRVLSRPEVCRGVAMLGGVTTADVAAGETGAQVHPARAERQAFFAARRAWRDFDDQLQMRTFDR